MGRSLSPLLRQELDNLDKDADSRRNAMKALKSYAKHLDSKSIPHFLAEVSDNKARRGCPPASSPSRSTSGGSFPLHQACSKVVPAIARYGIDPSTPDEEKAGIIASLCKPLCGALMGNQDGAASGAALCLKALVESSNWRFAAGETVNEVCLKVAGAMHDKSTQSNAHMALAMALVKHNGLIAEAYARSLVRSALQILDGDTAESSSQKRLSAIQMINFFMKFVDPRSISSELSKVVDIMEQCQNDRMPFVRGAAFEASQTAKSIAAQKGSRHEVSTSPMVGSNFQRRREKSPCRSLWNAKGMAASPVQFQSPESHVVDSSIMCESTITESPVSIGQSSCNFDQNRRTNRRLWSNDGVDVSLKDGLFFRLCSDGKYLEDDLDEVCDSEVTDTNFECTNSFSGFVSASPNGATSRDKTPSPQASERPISIDDVKIYTTPRKLLRSLQSSYDFDSARNEERSIAKLNSSSSPSEESNELEESSEEMQSQLSDSKIEEAKYDNETIDAQSADDTTQILSNEDKSVLCTPEVEDASCKASSEGECKEQDICVTRSMGKSRKYKAVFSFLLSIVMIVLAIIAVLIRIESYDDYVGLVPT
ncbi:hypothetical protein OsJ_34374 [Oryza sativa Japonica Group]|uniref:Uncharacterized protein n=1 Tax=Oryza sativa subsp. japonica TaxID=39947 RepID=B9G872_ORYSJ|nr:hypothetical protein OsJ_34374 [Oryza sativa Japonica Group]